MTDVLKPIKYQYLKPVNFDENNPEFDIFKNLPIENCYAPTVQFEKNVRISANSIMFRYFKIFKESCASEAAYENCSKNLRFFFKFIIPKINFSKKRFLLITDEWTSNYYHWHVFALKKLLILKEKNLIEGSLLFLPKRYLRYPFTLPSLEKFGIKKDQIVFVSRKSNIKVSEAPLIKMPQQHPAMFQELQKILLKDIKKFDLDFGDRIYVSRSEQTLRFVENEKELIALLAKYGFKKVVMERFSYDEQVEICSKTKYLISPHGAGLTNLLFVPQGASVLEMATPPDMQKPVTDYYKLSSMLGIKYFYQECELGPNSPVLDFHHGSLVVDLEKLERNLKLMLGNSE